MISAIIEYQFMQNAFEASLLASLVCGIIGVIIIEKKMVMMSGGIAHTAYGGVGFGYFLNIEPIIGAMIFAVAAAFGIGIIKRKGGVQTDVIIGLFWSLGMALGIVFIALTPGYPPDVDSYLFGNILTVTKAEIRYMLILSIIILFFIILFYNYWKAYLFDDEFATIIGVKTVFLEFLLLVLVAMTVVVLIRVAGIILILALLTAPSALASMFSKKFLGRLVGSVIFGAVFCVSGLWISYELNIASGACIVIVSVTCYFLVYAIRLIYNRIKRKKIV